MGFNAYQGLPGPYIKWFLKSLGHEGLIKMLQPYSNKTAEAMCTIGYFDKNLVEPKLFIGKTKGKIVESRGKKDFGWDAIF